MQKILVTAGTTALALKVKNLLNNKYEVILASADEVPSVLQKSFVALPKLYASTYIHEMLKMSLDNSVDFVLPLDMEEINILNQNLALFEEYGVSLLVPDVKSFSDIPKISLIPNGLELVLLYDGVDMISGKSTEVFQNGLGVLSDSGVDLLLVVA